MSRLCKPEAGIWKICQSKYEDQMQLVYISKLKTWCECSMKEKICDSR